jgi:hypothetical protein
MTYKAEPLIWCEIYIQSSFTRRSNCPQATNCADCQDFLSSPLEDGREIYFYKTIDEVEANSRQGCEFCHLLCCVAAPKGRDLMRKLKVAELCMKVMKGVKLKRWSLHWYYVYSDLTVDRKMDPVAWLEGCLPNVVLSPVEVNDERMLGGNGRDNKSRNRWDIARDWLRVCVEEHAGCRQVADYRGRQLPTRLVCTGVSGQTVRVCLGAELPSDTIFSTLSHCWGQHVPLKLLQGNLDVLHKRIPEKELSTTFRDALLIATSLGIEYIWIDSLW